MHALHGWHRPLRPVATTALRTALTIVLAVLLILVALPAVLAAVAAAILLPHHPQRSPALPRGRGGGYLATTFGSAPGGWGRAATLDRDDRPSTMPKRW